MSSSSENTSVDSRVSDPPAPTRGTRLEVKRIDKARVPSTGNWTVFNTEDLVTENLVDEYAAYDEYVFIYQRTIVQYGDFPSYTFLIIIQSDCLQRAVQEVMMEDVQNLSWHFQPLNLDPQLLLAFLPRLREHLARLHQDELPTDQDRDNTADHLSFLLDFLEVEYAAVLQEIKTLTSLGKITFDLLWSILVPPSVMFMSCKTTSEPRAVRLRKSRLETGCESMYWKLDCDYVEGNDGWPGQIWGLAAIVLEISYFEGVKKITELNTYPMDWHLNKDEIQAKILERGRRWLGMAGVHHMHYNGMAYRYGQKVKVDGRIMIDRRTFSDADPNYPRGSTPREVPNNIWNDYDSNAPEPVRHVGKYTQATDIRDDDILLATPILYGFSLAEKRWLEFNVERVRPIKWNDEGFKNIAIDPNRKALIQSLVESHVKSDPFDDFVQGKGRGLVINLFGPPGVGKTLTVETISEYLRKPLYIVTAGELGTDPFTLDNALTKIFALIPVWNAVVLIDEADVFLEERAVADVQRNAMVAVFLRQLEYFGGILFLTTNRVKTFDRAFQSRIHLALHYTELSRDARERLWRAFLEKTVNPQLGLQYPTTAELRKLSKQDLNGRQIKNVVKLAATLAIHMNEELSYHHMVRALDAIEDPQRRNDFQPMRYLGFGFLAFGLLSACAILHILHSK